MERSPLPELQLTPGEAEVLLDIADQAIVDGLAGRQPHPPAYDALPAALQRRAGVFVTLTVDGDLNGCIGSIEPTEAIGHATARLAWAAAFTDPRLPPLSVRDYDRLAIEISVLSPLTPIPAASRSELLAQLRPDEDGLVLKAGRRQAVFLPAVWEKIPEPAAFVDHLQAKAGLVRGAWAAGTEAFRFTVEKWCRPPVARRGRAG